MEKSERIRVLAISGSTRKNSANDSILRYIASTYHQLEVDLYDQINQLPHFNPDQTGDLLPIVVRELHQRISDAAAVIICTPEYVFSLPGALKNALEWTVSASVFSDKPVALIVASGLGEKTYESLQLIMKTLGAKWTAESQLLIQGARSKLFQGEVTDPQTRREIDVLVTSVISNFGFQIPK